MSHKYPSASDSPPRRIEAGWLAAIVLAAFLVRLAYLYQVEGLPFFYHPIGDAKAYWEWSGRIAAGDWLGSEAFYQAPAYPYFLAVVRRVVGDDLWRVRVAQIVLGSVACGLLALAGRWFLSASAGLWCGGIMALYGPAIFFDGLIQKAGLSFALMAGLLSLMGWMVRHGAGAAPALGAGIASGLLALTAEQALLVIGVILVWLIVGRCGAESVAPGFREDGGRLPGAGAPGYRQSALRGAEFASCEVGAGEPAVVGGVAPASRRCVVSSIAFVFGAGLVLGAVAWRNHHVGGVWAVTTVQAGPNFYIGNHEGATGRYTPLVPGRETPEFERRDAVELAERAAGRSLSAGEVSRYWSGRAWAWIGERPWDWLRLMGLKWLLVWNAYEIPDTESYTLYRDFSWLLGVLGRVDHFGILVPLAVLGLVMTLGQWRRLWPLYAMLLALAAGVAVFYVFGRYRYPGVPVLALFAGHGAERIYHWLRERSSRTVSPCKERGDKSRGSLGVGLAVVGFTAVATNWPINPERELDALAYANLGAVLGQQGNYDAAAYCLERAVRGAPASVDAHFNLAMAYRLRGDVQQALEAFRRVKSMDPRRVEVDFQLGGLYEALGELDAAIRHYRQALEVDPNDTQARERLERLLTAKTPSPPRN